jgi:hypothetical protein
MNGQTAAVLGAAFTAIVLVVLIIEYFHHRHGGHGCFGGTSHSHGDRVMLVPEVRRDHHWVVLMDDPDGHTHAHEDEDVVTNDVLTNELAGHVRQDHKNLANTGQIDELQRQIDVLRGQLERQGRQGHRRWRFIRAFGAIDHPFPWDLVGFIIGAIVGVIYDQFLPAHYYRLPLITNVYVSKSGVKIDHILISDPLKLFGVVLLFAVLGWMIGRIVQEIQVLIARRRLARAEDAELDEAAEEQP